MKKFIWFLHSEWFCELPRMKGLFVCMCRECCVVLTLIQHLLSQKEEHIPFSVLFQLQLPTPIYTMSWTFLLELYRWPQLHRRMRKSWRCTKGIMETLGTKEWKRSATSNEACCWSAQSVVLNEWNNIYLKSYFWNHILNIRWIKYGFWPGFPVLDGVPLLE